MARCRIIPMCLVIFIALVFSNIQAQDYFDSTLLVKDSLYYEINLEDNNTITGKLIDYDEETLTFAIGEKGRLTVKRDQIKQLYAMDGKGRRKDLIWHKNKFANKYFMFPSAIPMEKGTVHYQNIMVLGQVFKYGLTDYLSVGAGFDFLSIAEAISGYLNIPVVHLNVNAATKVTDEYHVGVGGIILNYSEVKMTGGLYAMNTIGPPDANVTLGVGLHFTEDGFIRHPVYNLSAIKRVSNKVSILTENYLIYDIGLYAYRLWLSGGVRISWEKISIDFGLLNSREMMEHILIFGLPFIDCVIKL